jgi:hypothetical protein
MQMSSATVFTNSEEAPGTRKGVQNNSGKEKNALSLSTPPVEQVNSIGEHESYRLSVGNEHFAICSKQRKIHHAQTMMG